MSGLAKGIGKVFRGAVKAVGKIAPIAIPAALALGTGGLAAPALGAMGTAAATTAATSGATTAAGSGLMGGLGGALKGVLSSPLAGNLISGAAAGWGEGARMREREEQDIRAEERRSERYKGLGDALSWDEPRPSTGLANRRPGLAEAAGSGKPRWRYDRESGQLVRA